jgi:hypothetical protein
LVETVEDKEMVEDMEDFVTEEPVEDIGVGRELGWRRLRSMMFGWRRDLSQRPKI